MERWASTGKEWLFERLSLPPGSRLPSHDTSGRVFARLDGNAPENTAALRRLSMNLLRQEKTHKVGVAIKCGGAGWACDYLRNFLLKVRAARSEPAP